MEGYVVERENCGSELSDVLSTHSLPMTADWIEANSLPQGQKQPVLIYLLKYLIFIQQMCHANATESSQIIVQTLKNQNIY
jgi:hypothetical protein